MRIWRAPSSAAFTSATPPSGFNALYTATAVWTGTEMILWGLDGGYRYKPATDTWRLISTAGGPVGTFNAVWQYRGWVPLSKIVNGSVDANNPGLGTQHWTAGCHGSVGFLHEVLRVLNVPVQPVWISGHELAYFTSEKLYLDHGDDPYNAVPKSYPASPILGLLIDEPTYKSWFTSDLTVNITDPYSPALANVGRSAANFH